MDERLREALERSLSGGRSSQGGALASSCRALDAARSLGAVLDSLAASAGSIADRAALFVVRNGRLRVWRMHGFARPAAGSPMPEAVRARTFPVLVGGRVVAVVHAEAVYPEERSTAADAWPEMLDVLACHAGRVLESMTLHLALGLTAPRLERARV